MSMPEPDAVARPNEVTVQVRIEGRVYRSIVHVPPIETGLNLHQLGYAVDRAADALIARIGTEDCIPGPYPPRVPDPNSDRGKRI